MKRGIFVLRGRIFIGEVKEEIVRDEKKLGVSVSTLEESLVEMVGLFI